MKGDGRDENNLGDFQILKLNFWAQGHYIVYISSKKTTYFYLQNIKQKWNGSLLFIFKYVRKKSKYWVDFREVTLKSLLLIHIWYSEVFSFKSGRKPMLLHHAKTKKNKKLLAPIHDSLRLVWLQRKFFIGRQTASFRTHIPPLGSSSLQLYGL